MTKDYAKPITTRKQAKAKTKAQPARAQKKSNEPEKPKPRRFGLFIILLAIIGTFVYGLTLLKSIPPTTSLTDNQTIEPKQFTQLKPAPEKTAQAHRFEFYDLLPESKIDTSNVDAYHYKEKSNQANIRYTIQTGSFKTAADADRQKAKIAFLGLKAHIKSITSSSGATWHRVMLGPFRSRSKMNKALDKLVSINLEPLVRKIKKES